MSGKSGRYQTIDTLTGEVVRESDRHPMLDSLVKRPRRTTYRRRPRSGRHLSSKDQNTGLIILAAIVLLIAIL